MDNLIQFRGLNPDWHIEGKRHAAVAKIELTEEKLRLRQGKLDGKSKELLLVKPQTFMNLSGEAIQPLLSFYKIPSHELLVLSDDLDQEFGAIKYKPKGSSGGQNGIKNIIQKLGTDVFFRLKIGIGRSTDPRFESADRVLSQLHESEVTYLNSREFLLSCCRYIAAFLQGKK